MTPVSHTGPLILEQMPVYNIKWTDWFLYVFITVSLIHTVPGFTRCFALTDAMTHTGYQTLKCVRGYLTSYMDICELMAVFFGVFS